MHRSCRAFTLVELLVSVVVLTLLVVMVSSMVNSAASVATKGNKRMDADSQVRPVLDRMAVDFSQMIKRSDIDYYVKGLDPEIGNDRIAFFCNVQGYYPSTGSPSPISIVAYRINSSAGPSLNRLERMGKGLMWSATSPAPSSTPYPPWIIFGPTPTLQANWPSATTGDPTNADYKDSDYELIGPQIFRFEYFYLLKTGAVSGSPGISGLQDVAAISVAIAAIDQKSRVLLSNCQIDGNSSSACGPYASNGLVQRLNDFDVTKLNPKSYDLTTDWQAALEDITDMPRTAINGVRIYQRYFYLTPVQ